MLLSSVTNLCNDMVDHGVEWRVVGGRSHPGVAFLPLHSSTASWQQQNLPACSHAQDIVAHW